jgi:hypothetical protein
MIIFWRLMKFIIFYLLILRTPKHIKFKMILKYTSSTKYRKKLIFIFIFKKTILFILH